VWTDVMQLTVYLTGGMAALAIAWQLGGGPHAALALARQAGKLRLIDPAIDFTTTYTLLGGLIGGALLSAASHGTDHLIVQRLLGSRSLRDARIALVGSGMVVILQFLLFLLVGSAIWSAGLVPGDLPADQIFPRFVVEHLPPGLAGLLIAGILAAAMGTHSSAINSLASSVTHDLYAGWTGRKEPGHLLRIGRRFSAMWGAMLIIGALFFFFYTRQGDTPVVVLALSIASVTYGGLLGTYVLAGRWPRATGRDAGGAIAVTVAVMLVVVFARRLAEHPGLEWLAPAGHLAWPWYVPLGTILTIGAGMLLSLLPHSPGRAA
ncbi:MAG: sodium:solute symporter family transporter, partial [Gemmatimonadales bacterium]